MAHRGELTVTRERVLELVSAGNDWAAVGRELRISPGLAFMIGTGVPADGGGVPDLQGRAGAAALDSPQALINPRGHNPTRNERVETWVSARAARDLKR